jgi:hypothetical protein
MSKYSIWWKIFKSLTKEDLNPPPPTTYRHFRRSKLEILPRRIPEQTAIQWAWLFQERSYSPTSLFSETTLFSEITPVGEAKTLSKWNPFSAVLWMIWCLFSFLVVSFRANSCVWFVVLLSVSNKAADYGELPQIACAYYKFL